MAARSAATASAAPSTSPSLRTHFSSPPYRPSKYIRFPLSSLLLPSLLLLILSAIPLRTGSSPITPANPSAHLPQLHRRSPASAVPSPAPRHPVSAESPPRESAREEGSPQGGCGAREGSAGERSSWEALSRLSTANDAEYRALVAPMAELAANAYRWSFAPVKEVPGWRLAERVPPVAPIDGGMHALVFEEDTSCNEAGRGSEGSAASEGDAEAQQQRQQQADLCADHLLWGDPSAPPPAFCARFPPATLDYYSQALALVGKVRGGDGGWGEGRKREQGSFSGGKRGGRVERGRGMGETEGGGKERGPRLVTLSSRALTLNRTARPQVLSEYGRDTPVLLTGDALPCPVTVACRAVLLLGLPGVRVGRCADERHSLGGGLAVLASAAFSSAPLPLSATPPLSSRALTATSAAAAAAADDDALFSGSLVLPVLAFSAAGARGAAQRRHLTFAAERSHLAYSIADVWDPLIQLAPHQQLGALCLYRSPEPPPCLACYGNGSLSSSTRSNADVHVGDGNGADTAHDEEEGKVSLPTFPPHLTPPSSTPASSTS
ncbi:unnamed protein product [Closterium sp. Naga37s-1]|nr:unnamed protein product [Closterium sp. Naga37s-1]